MPLEPDSRPALYLETTIVSYHTARPSRDIVTFSRQELTRRWWEAERGNYRTFISPFVIEEASGGDPEAASRRLSLLADIESLAPTEDVQSLATRIRVATGLPPSAHGDSLHLSYAIYYELDYLLTWNCGHLANGPTLRRLTDFTKTHGLWLPIVCTPEAMVASQEG
jgi:hypothetical protein